MKRYIQVKGGEDRGRPPTKKELIINDLKKTDMSQSEIARKYGVSRQYVSQIAIEWWGRV